MAKVHERKQTIVEEFRAGVRHRLEGAKKVELIFGQARFTGPKVVDVMLTAGGVRTLTADRIFINTGARPARPNVTGSFDSSSESPRLLHPLWSCKELPEHLLVLGGGYVGLEFGQMFRRFGSAVTIVQRGKQLLGREDPDVAEEVCKLMQGDGIEVLLESEVVGGECSASGRCFGPAGPCGHSRTINGTLTLLLRGWGRVPNSEQLSLRRRGVNVNARGFISVDDRLQTNIAGIYALRGRQRRADIWRTFRTMIIVSSGTTFLRGGQSSIKGRLVPYTVYIDPQLGRIGLT